MNLDLFHGLTKDQKQVESTGNKSMNFIYQVQGRSNALDIYERNQRYKNETKIEHACRELDPTKQTSGP